MGLPVPGKNRYAQRLIEKNPRIQRISSYTTKHGGSHYHHISEEEFEDMRNEFFETSSYMGHLYGTKESDIQIVIDQGKIPLLVMDINGMIAMKAKYPYHGCGTSQRTERPVSGKS